MRLISRGGWIFLWALIGPIAWGDEPTGAALTASTESTAVFARPATMPWEQLPAGQGYAQVQLADLLAAAEALELTQVSMFEQSVETTAGLVWRMIAQHGQTELWNELQLTPRQFKTVAISPEFAVRRSREQDPASDNKSRASLTLSTSQIVIHSDRPIDWDRLRQAIDPSRAASVLRSFAPDWARALTEDQRRSPSLIVEEMLLEAVHQPDPQMLVINGRSESSASPAPFASSEARMQHAWQAIDGGLASVCLGLDTVEPTAETNDPRPIDQAIDQLVARAECLAVGVDLDRAAGELVLRVAIVPRAATSAEELREAVRGLWAAREPESDVGDWQALADELAPDRFATRPIPNGGEMIFATARCPLPPVRVAEARSPAAR